MPTHDTRIDFSEFGKRFMDRAVTAARINESVSGLLKKVKPDDLHGTKSIDGHEVRFNVVLDAPQTSRTSMDESLMGFNIALPMSVAIEVLAVPDHPTYALRVLATISLVVSTHSPLLIVIEPLPVTANSVQVKVEDKDEGIFTWLAGIFGRNIEEQVTEGVKQTAATVIAKSLAAAADSLTIDVEKKVGVAMK